MEFIVESMGMDHDWGYATRHPFALKRTYGTTRDLKELIDQCHQRRIRVLLDIVLNHSTSDCPLQIIDHDYWVIRFLFSYLNQLIEFSA